MTQGAASAIVALPQVDRSEDTLAVRPSSNASTIAAVERVPWFLWMGALAITLIQVGAIWDLSWHRSIGRDSFWTPAHIMVQTGGILAAVVCGYLVFSTTFGHSVSARLSSVSVFGLRAPMGAFVAAWGGITMVVSAPFDNWWHATYGLDVKIISPPHAILLCGALGVEMGILLLSVAALNRAEHDHSPALRALEWLFLYVGGVVVVSQMYYAFTYLNNNFLHGARPYKATGLVVMAVLLMIAQAHQTKWAATTISAVYMAVMIASMQILQLFPAQPKLGPVFYPITHMVPTNFPILIIFPAMALDLMWRRTRQWNPWILAPLSAVVFLAVLVTFEWPFADFLMTKFAENRFFGTNLHGFTATGADLLHAFQAPDSHERFSSGMLKALLLTTISGWLGILLGRWMRGVQR